MTELELKLIEAVSKQVADLSALVKTMADHQLTLQKHIADIYSRMGLTVKQEKKPDVLN